MTDKNKNILKVKKSIFIPFLEHIENIDDVKVIVKKYREKYKDSSHICWGYILNENIFGCSDNGEPHGTAGLQKNQKRSLILWGLLYVILVEQNWDVKFLPKAIEKL